LALGGIQAILERLEHRATGTLFIQSYQRRPSSPFSFTGCKLEERPAGGDVSSPSLKPGGFTSHFALKSLTASDAVWRDETNLFTLFGLPGQREALSALIL
jgi:hypothetical protein